GALHFDDPDGRFTYDGIRAGDYQLIVQAEGFIVARQDVKLDAGEEESVEISLDSGGRIEGVILDAETGAPVEGAEVHAGRRASTPDIRLDLASAFTAADGTFVLAGLTPGAYAPSARHPFYRSRSADEPIEIGPGDTARVELRADPAGRLEGRIKGPMPSSNEGQIHRSLRLQPAGAPPKNPTGFEHIGIDPQSRFEMDSIRPGRYDVDLVMQAMRPGKSIHLGPNGGVQMMEPLGAETKTRVAQVEIRPRETTHLQVSAPAAE
ncbi:MAG TPA: carboxypeptidase-like regulatory domain-containing protein, partial [Planctomycetota bacterium]|nr:carboxypeptidase-like regulatory domain-containing protein [Planctomycetota bacterium]